MAHSLIHRGLLACLLLAVILAAPAWAGAQSGFDSQKFIAKLAAMGDRSLGAPGYDKAAKLVERTLKSLAPEGGRMGRQYFQAPVRLHKGSKLILTADGSEHPIRPILGNAIWPGTVAEPGLEGPLVYAGRGELDDFNGKDVAGAVVLMEMDSGKNWLNAANLGAKALIYLDPDTADGAPRTRFEDKFEFTPIAFPRFWMTKKQAQNLLGPLESFKGGETDSPRVRLTSDIAWHNALGRNIHCLIPGSDKKLEEELLVVQAYFDSKVQIPGLSPGAEEAVSLAALLELAEKLKASPPKRPVLLLVTGGHGQALAGMREFMWAVSSRSRTMRKTRKALKKRRNEAGKTADLLSRTNPLAPAEKDEQPFLNQAISTAIKVMVDRLNTRLNDMRLGEQGADSENKIKELADLRMAYRRLGWREDFSKLSPAEHELLMKLAPEAQKRAQESADDAALQYKIIDSALKTRRITGARRVVASVSLELSSHGGGVGAFSQGWMYELYPGIDRTRAYINIDKLLKDTAKEQQEKGGQDLFRDTLRPNLRYPWRNYLPDRPYLSGEVAALGAWPGFSLVTVHDAHPRLATPYDLPQYMDQDYLRAQGELTTALLLALANQPVPHIGFQAQKGFSNIYGRANLLRQGELFPDQPATGAVVQVYQGPDRYFYAMVDTMGEFRAVGLANRKHTEHKAILETYGFNDQGRIVWAVDKKQTGKDAYRIKMYRADMETSLVMFACRQTTIFNTLEPRNFTFMWRLELIDGRTETLPMRYWYSRLDTWRSSIQSIFLEPGAYLKAALSDTMLGRKMLLLNSSPDNPQGGGYAVASTPSIPYTAYRAAKDMWNLLGSRINNLEQRGIFNQRIGKLRDEGKTTLAEAKKAFEQKQYGLFFGKARESLALASRVYNDVDRTQKDVLFGVLFYVALFIPFAYCVERLAFGFVNIHKRIIAFLAILAITIGIVYLVHPAFQLTYSPMVVILAFFIVGLSILVSLIIFFRFENEMVNLQMRAKHMKVSQISKGKAFAASFVIGVSNLRRRPIRTMLTCATLVILTFTIMNFTAVKSARELGKVRFSHNAPYHGMLLRSVGWRRLPVETLTMAGGSFENLGVISPRIWLESEDRTQGVLIPVSSPAAKMEAIGMVGLGAAEPRVSGLDQKILARGRWFKPDERYVVLLPRRMAERLQVEPGKEGADTVRIWGMPFKVIGTFKDNALEQNPDLDAEPLTPVVYTQEPGNEVLGMDVDAVESGEDMALYQSRYEHDDGNQTLIVPAETMLALGGELKGFAAGLNPGTDTAALADYLSDRFGLMLFHGEKDGTSLHYAADTINYKGMPNVIIPLIIAILIVLNTMIGSVFERKREIGIYTSVGMAPSHVAFLFIAESVAFAVMSVVAGYLLAQTAAHFLAGTAIWAGMTANYSSMAGVAAMFLVIAVVLISSIYPSKVAANIAIPDVNRSWKMPEAQNNELVILLPFLIKAHEQMCAGGFILDYYAAHSDISHGAFSTDQITSDFACPLDKGGLPMDDMPDCFNVRFVAWLAPFDFGVRQRVHLNFCPSDNYQGFLEVRIVMARESGEKNVWQRLARSFINDLRKQLLVWRSLEEEAREGYIKLMEDHLDGKLNDQGVGS